MQKISPCLWYNNNAEEAAKFYQGIFNNVKILGTTVYDEASAKGSGQPVGSTLTVEFTLEDQTILCINGGDYFKHTPSLSFFVYCTSEKEIDEMWKKLSAGGRTYMGLDKYPWADKYGWAADKFGVQWQLMLAPNKNRVVPSFLLVNDMFGRGEEAIKFYSGIFGGSKIESMAKDPAKGTVMHAAFTLNNQPFNLMEGEGKHEYKPSEAFSLMINCDSQAEIDKYWDALVAGGGEHSQCGWLKDKFGFSWQVAPAFLSELKKDPKRGARVMAEVMKMTKLDYEKLKNA